MTNVAISISSDVSRSLSSLLPFLPAKTNLSPFFFLQLCSLKRAKKRERDEKRDGGGGSRSEKLEEGYRSGWSRIGGRAWNSDVYRIRARGSSGGASAFTSVSLG